MKRKLNTYIDKEELDKLYIEYGENVKDVIHEECLINPSKRKEYYTKFIEHSKRRGTYEKVKHFTENSKKLCNKTQREYYVWCFHFKKGHKDGLRGYSCIASNLQQKVKSCRHRSLKRLKSGTIKEAQNEITELNFLRLFKSQNWKCAWSNKQLHGSSNVEGYFTLDRIDDDLDYRLDNVRIIHSNYQSAHTHKIMCIENLNPEYGIKIPLPVDVEDMYDKMTKHSRILDKGDLRKCTRCLCWKIRNNQNFYDNKGVKTGFSGQCKICYKNKSRKNLKKIIIDEGSTRKCAKCQIFKDRQREFHKSKKEKAGYNSVCKACLSTQKEPHLIVQQLIARCKYSDRKLFRTDKTTLSVQDVADLFRKQGGRCTISKRPLLFVSEGSKFNISVDRINPDLPHTPANCQLIIALLNVRSKGRKV